MATPRIPKDQQKKRGRKGGFRKFRVIPGTPREPIPIDLDKVREAAGRGMTLEQIGLLFGIGETALVRYKHEHPEFEESYKAGRSEGMDKVTGVLFRRAMDGDLGACIFFLKTQGRWREKDPVNVHFHGNNATNPGDVARLSDADLERIAQRANAVIPGLAGQNPGTNGHHISVGSNGNGHHPPAGSNGATSATPSTDPAD